MSPATLKFGNNIEVQFVDDKWQEIVTMGQEIVAMSMGVPKHLVAPEGKMSHGPSNTRNMPISEYKRLVQGRWPEQSGGEMDDWMKEWEEKYSTICSCTKCVQYRMELKKQQRQTKQQSFGDIKYFYEYEDVCNINQEETMVYQGVVVQVTTEGDTTIVYTSEPFIASGTREARNTLFAEAVRKNTDLDPATLQVHVESYTLVL